MRFKLWNNIFGWVAFIISATVYLMTIEPTASFWDCGEFIASAFKFEVGHPPGDPTYMLFARFFSLFASDNTQVAMMVNAMSGIFSALTVLLLFWTITYFAKKMLVKDGEMTLGQLIAIIGSGLVGSLAFTFSDTFWFSAVEGEVYASSSLFTALVFWLIAKWDAVADEKFSNRWIVLIAFVMGLSIGVHLLNLLAIPAIVFLVYFRKFKTTKKGILYSSLISVIALVAIMYGIVQGIFKVASWFELLFVNGMSLPFNSGLLFFVFLLVVLIFLGIYVTTREVSNIFRSTVITLLLFFTGIPLMIDSVLFWIIFLPGVWAAIYYIKSLKPVLNTLVLCVAMIILGYSTFAIVLIRSNANPPLDENNPENVFSLISYLNREQYGDRPLFYGQTFVTPLDSKERYITGDPVYIQKDGKYLEIDHKQKPNYDSQFCMLFPRMHSSDPNHVSAYKTWSNFKGTPVNSVTEDGTVQKIYKPTFVENIKFFVKYQIGFMYFRYFMWNFAGRQNDIQGHGSIINGNWISGISALDEARLGPQDNLPEALGNNKAKNAYFFLPLILGLIGMYFHYLKDSKGFVIVALMFFFTGLAIVIYLNQTPYQPRERDYAYVGSFYAFTIWIGLGVAALYQLLSKRMPAVLTAGAITVVCLSVPAVMANENWDDHDRSNCYSARDFAKNYLESCEPNAILFTNGDNDTFPLWYAQEVEGVRTDVRVVNLSLLNTDWYIEQMKWKAYKSEPLPISFTYDQIAGERRVYVPVQDQIKNAVDIGKIIEFVKSDQRQAKLQVSQTEWMNYVPSKQFSFKVDTIKVLQNKTIKPSMASQMVSSIDWTITKNYLYKSELTILDLLANNKWDRPINFAITVGGDSYMNLDDYFRLDGLAYRLTPVKANNKDGQTGWIDTDILYNNLMNKFVWGGINRKDVYLNENNLRMTMNFRNNFARLASALIDEGKRDSAVKVLDRCMEIMPAETVPYNVFVLGVAEAYYRAGEMAKATAIMEKMKKMTEGELDYYLSLDKEYTDMVENETKRAMSIMQELQRLTKTYKQDEMSKKIEDKFKIYYEKFVTLFNIQQ
jgi:hypothetical protein